MPTHSGRALGAPLVGAVLLAVILVAVWGASPEAVLVPLLLVAACAEVILYAVLCVVERRRHW
ncbi:MAG: hypothetical protein ACHQ2E_12355 [Gemmatimonadales bacterium]